MIMKMLTRGGVMVAGLMVTNAVIEKLEKASINRDVRKQKENSEKEEEFPTEEDVQFMKKLSEMKMS